MLHFVKEYLRKHNASRARHFRQERDAAEAEIRGLTLRGIPENSFSVSSEIDRRDVANKHLQHYLRKLNKEK